MKRVERSNVIPFSRPIDEAPKSTTAESALKAASDDNAERLMLEPHHAEPLVVAMARGALHGAAAFVESLHQARRPERRTAPKKLLKAPRNERAEFMDEKELCATLGIASVTATKWRARREGPPFVKLGRLVRYRRSDVATWLDASHRETGR